MAYINKKNQLSWFKTPEMLASCTAYKIDLFCLITIFLNYLQYLLVFLK